MERELSSRTGNNYDGTKFFILFFRVSVLRRQQNIARKFESWMYWQAYLPGYAMEQYDRRLYHPPAQVGTYAYEFNCCGRAASGDFLC